MDHDKRCRSRETILATSTKGLVGDVRVEKLACPNPSRRPSGCRITETSQGAITSSSGKLHLVGYGRITNATLREFIITKILTSALEHRPYIALVPPSVFLYQSPIISFIRSFFTRASSPATMSAAKTKAQEIIDSNGVGKNIIAMPCAESRPRDLTYPCISRLLQVILPLLQGYQAALVLRRSQVLRHRA